eukprot:2635308-Prymnesium_polylepis.1
MAACCGAARCVSACCASACCAALIERARRRRGTSTERTATRTAWPTATTSCGSSTGWAHSCENNTCGDEVTVWAR